MGFLSINCASIELELMFTWFWILSRKWARWVLLIGKYAKYTADSMGSFGAVPHTFQDVTKNLKSHRKSYYKSM